MSWTPVPLTSPILEAAEETALRGQSAALENAILSEAGTVKSFPGLSDWASVNDDAELIVYPYQGDLIAVSRGGRVYRGGPDGELADVTGAPVTGKGRPVFADAGTELIIAAGGRLVRLTGQKTEVLPNAPPSSHVASIKGYVIAIEVGSGRFYHSEVGNSSSWNPLDTFSAEGKGDNLVAAAVTPNEELLLIGSDSIEQFAASAGSTPFAQRWAIGSGVSAPYTVFSDDSGIWGLDKHREWVRFVGGGVQPQSDAVAVSLSSVDDWTDAWAAPFRWEGQRLAVIQAPMATNRYGTQGVTLLYDQRRRRWAALYAWDHDLAIPTGWPGRSVCTQWGRTFVGGAGKVWEMRQSPRSSGGQIQRWMYRSGHIARTEGMWLSKARLRMVRGQGPGFVNIRCNRDDKGFDRWRRIPLGGPGDSRPWREFGGFGSGDSFQFEVMVTDPIPVELLEFQLSWVPVTQ